MVQSLLLILAGAYLLLAYLPYRMARKEMNFTRFSASIIALISPILVIVVLALRGKALKRVSDFMDKWLPMYTVKKKNDD